MNARQLALDLWVFSVSFYISYKATNRLSNHFNTDRKEKAKSKGEYKLVYAVKKVKWDYYFW